MKYFYCALCAFFAATVAVHAQQSPQEEEIITDFGTDEYVYIPKTVLHIGVRAVSGVKTAFWGQGVVSSTQAYGAFSGMDIFHNYHDGFVRPDARTQLDANGNPRPVSPDGKTNTWAYLDPNQLTSDGMVTMNAYSAAITDTSTRSQNGGNSLGVDISLTRDIGSLFNTRARWGVVAGVTLNDINAKTTAYVPTTITTVTDLYSLDGQVPAAAPYYAPSTSASQVLDANGNPLVNSTTGAAQTQNVDNSTLLSSQPLSRTTTTVANNTTSVKNYWKLKGAYMTFRFGPTVFIPITTHFNASFSAGAVLVYAGTTYTVMQTYHPATSDDIIDTVSDGVSEFLPGFYVDADLNYTMTETAGMYLGAIYQSSRSYTQNISDLTSSYSTRVDLSRLQGVHAGMSFKF